MGLWHPILEFERKGRKKIQSQYYFQLGCEQKCRVTEVLELCIYLVPCSIIYKKTPWTYPASELYRPSDRRLSAKFVPTFADRGCRVVSATDSNGRILGFLDRSRYYFFQVAPQL
jgi:hypothetical protein